MSPSLNSFKEFIGKNSLQKYSQLNDFGDYKMATKTQSLWLIWSLYRAADALSTRMQAVAESPDSPPSAEDAWKAASGTRAGSSHTSGDSELDEEFSDSGDEGEDIIFKRLRSNYLQEDSEYEDSTGAAAAVAVQPVSEFTAVSFEDYQVQYKFDIGKCIAQGGEGEIYEVSSTYDDVALRGKKYVAKHFTSIDGLWEGELDWLEMPMNHVFQWNAYSLQVHNLPQEFWPYNGCVLKQITLDLGEHMHRAQGRSYFQTNWRAVRQALRFRNSHRDELKNAEVKKKCAIGLKVHQSQKHYLHEIEIFAKCGKHPNILSPVGLANVHVVDDARVNAGYLVFERMEINLREWLESYPNGAPIQQVRHIATSVAFAVHHLHNVGVVHRDLKLRNVMLNLVAGTVSDVKVIDFGIAVVESRTFAEIPKDKRYEGTPHFWAPEQFLLDKYHTDPGLLALESTGVDIWSMGSLLFELMTGQPFYEAVFAKDFADCGFCLNRKMQTQDKDALKIAIEEAIENNIPTTGSYTEHELLLQQAKDLLKQLLDPDPASRIKIDHVITHEFIEYGSDPALLAQQGYLVTGESQSHQGFRRASNFLMPRGMAFRRSDSILQVRDAEAEEEAIRSAIVQAPLMREIPLPGFCAIFSPFLPYISCGQVGDYLPPLGCHAQGCHTQREDNADLD